MTAKYPVSASDLSPYPLINGFCDPRFEPVAVMLNELFDKQLSRGCSVAAYHRGTLAFNLWGGTTDHDDQTPWREDTLTCVFSAGKPLSAVAILRLAQQGLVELDAPVARYWPEFGAAGKDAITLRHALCHRAGIPAFSNPVPDDDLYDWAAMVAHTAAIVPEWPAGQEQAYHAFTYGWVLGEVIHRVTGQMPGDYIRTEMCEPLGLDLHIGLADTDLSRVAVVKPKDPEQSIVGTPRSNGETGKPTLQQRVFGNPRTLQKGSNRRVWRQAQIPAGNTHGTALGLAALYNALCGHGDTELLDATGRARCREICSRSEADQVNVVPMAFSHGFFLSNPGEPAAFGRGRDCFGHPGAGGSIGFADPDYDFSFGFVTRDLGVGLFGRGKAAKLSECAYRCIADCA